METHNEYKTDLVQITHPVNQTQTESSVEIRHDKNELTVTDKRSDWLLIVQSGEQTDYWTKTKKLQNATKHRTVINTQCPR